MDIAEAHRSPPIKAEPRWGREDTMERNPMNEVYRRRSPGKYSLHGNSLLPKFTPRATHPHLYIHFLHATHPQLYTQATHSQLYPALLLNTKALLVFPHLYPKLSPALKRVLANHGAIIIFPDSRLELLIPTLSCSPFYIDLLATISRLKSRSSVCSREHSAVPHSRSTFTVLLKHLLAISPCG